jgi:hypothetical protein
MITSMMIRLAILVAICSAASLAEAQTSALEAPASNLAPSAAEPSPVWTWHPSLSVLGSVDENHDALTGTDPARFEEAELAGNLGAGLVGSAVTSRTHFAYDVFGLARSPVSGTMRSFYAGGRASWTWQFAHDWQLSASDSAKLQRQPSLPVAAFQRNEATLDVDWRPARSPVAWSLEIGDRRRVLPSLEILEFDRRSVTLTASVSRALSAASLGISVQPYRTDTASGRRIVISAEAGRFGHGGVASARYAYVGRWVDHVRDYRGEGHTELGEFGDIDRADFLEQLSLEGGALGLGSESVSLDPIETDSDDWDFGRNKHVIVGYVSRHLPGHALLSGSVRYQHRVGPNLLALPGTPSAFSFADSRLGMRVTFRQPLTPRLSGVAQISGLSNRSERASANFSRTLVGIGLQIQLDRRR